MLKKYKKLYVFLIVFAMVLSIGSDALVAFATNLYPDTITLGKEARETDDCRIYEVELNINGIPPKKPIDVVLVIDKSGSMGYKIPGDPKVPMDYAKEAAEAFATSVLADSNNRVALVSYSNSSSIDRNFTNDLSKITGKISGLNANGWTNTQDAFLKAKAELGNARVGATKAVVFLTDGVPTASNGNSNGPAINPTDITNHVTKAITAGTSIHPDSVFTVGLLGAVPDSGSPWKTRDIAKKVLTETGNALYIETLSAANLGAIYTQIQDSLQTSASNAVVEDVIGSNFEYVAGSAVATYVDINDNVQTVTLTTSNFNYDSGTGKITWKPGNIVKNAKLTYRIKAKEAFAGGEDVPTNEWAKLNYKDLNNVDKEKEFEVPKVDVLGKTGSIQIVKQLFEADGQTPITNDSTMFEFVVTGPGGYSQTVSASVNSPGLLDGLVAGEYTITESSQANYGHVDGNSKTVQLTINHCEDNEALVVIFKNKEDVKHGSLEIKKVIKDANGKTITDGRSFYITITGPSYPDGSDRILIDNIDTTVVGNLLPGDYTIVEHDSGYDVEINPSTITVVGNEQTDVTITNTEKKAGKLTIKKKLYVELEGIIDGVEFTIRVKGPNGYDEEFTIVSGTDLVINGLEYGTYSATELNAENYDVSISGPVTLDNTYKDNVIEILNIPKGDEGPWESDIDIIKSVEFGDEELAKLQNVVDRLNGLFANGALSDPPELADGIDEEDIDEVEELIDELIDEKIKEFAMSFINKARGLLEEDDNEDENITPQSLMPLDNEDDSEDLPEDEPENLPNGDNEEDEPKEDILEGLDGEQVASIGLMSFRSLMENNDNDDAEVQPDDEKQEDEEDQEDKEQDNQDEEDQDDNNQDDNNQDDNNQDDNDEDIGNQDNIDDDDDEEELDEEDVDENDQEEEQEDELEETEELPISAPIMLQLFSTPMDLELDDLLDHTDLSGFVFELFLVTEGGEESQGTATTDEDGKAKFKDVPEGSYILREVPKEGYSNDLGSGLSFHWNEENLDRYSKIYVVNTVEDKEEPEPDPTGRITIKKIDDRTERPLEGAVFTIRDSSGEIVDVIRTNGDGEAVSKELPYGDYTVEETQAPSGYFRNSEIHNVNINVDQEEFGLTIGNRRIPRDPGPDPDPDPDEPEDEPDEPEEEPEEPEEEPEEEEIEEEVPEDVPEEAEVKDEVVEEVVEKVPEAKPVAKPVATLPKTGAASPYVASGFGTLILALGIFLRKFRRK